jgi:alanine racemase
MAQNFSLIQSLAPQAEILPMVKADAYGNGVIQVAQFLVRDCDVKTLGCASLGEALKLVHECPELKAEILVFSDTELQNSKVREAYLHFNIIPVLHQESDLLLISQDESFAKLPLCVKLNTGMNRLGLSQRDLEAHLPLLKKRGIKHLATHFARSSQILKIGDKTHRQYEEFKSIHKFLTDAGVAIEQTSVSNSGAIEQGFGVQETFVRPGLMLYGPPSVTEPILWQGHQTSRFVTKILSGFPVKKGTPVGYGVNVADKDSFMVIIPVGYGDGLLTFYTGSKIHINGLEGKIFGRINMDMAFVQFPPDAETKLRPEDLVEIWNHDNRVITDFAAQNKTIAYQLMCGISGRIPRIYKVK